MISEEHVTTDEQLAAVAETVHRVIARLRATRRADFILIPPPPG
ncbi:hypothetical protein ACFV2I_20350 [Streptomyces microflavus]